MNNQQHVMLQLHITAVAFPVLQYKEISEILRRQKRPLEMQRSAFCCEMKEEAAEPGSAVTM